MWPVWTYSWIKLPVEDAHSKYSYETFYHECFQCDGEFYGFGNSRLFRKGWDLLHATLLACVWARAGAKVLLFIFSKWKRRKKMERLDLMTLVSGSLFGHGLVVYLWWFRSAWNGWQFYWLFLWLFKFFKCMSNSQHEVRPFKSFRSINEEIVNTLFFGTT